MNRAEAKQKAQALVAQMDVLEAAAQLSYDAPPSTVCIFPNTTGGTKPSMVWLAPV